MATKRVAQSAVNWTAFAERVPANQKDAFRAFKARSDMFVSRVHKYPENMPAIDWSFYQTRLANPSMVEQFKKSYEAVKVNYPTDKFKMKESVETQEKSSMQASAKQVAAIQEQINEVKALQSKIDSLPPIEEMTQEMYSFYFPDYSRDPWNKPTFYPHTKIHQPKVFGGTDKDEKPPGGMSIGKYHED